MVEIDIPEWTVEQANDSSILLAGPDGEVVLNRGGSKASKQIWLVDAQPYGQEPKSWKVHVESRDGLLSRVLPDLLANITQITATE